MLALGFLGVLAFLALFNAADLWEAVAVLEWLNMAPVVNHDRPFSSKNSATFRCFRIFLVLQGFLQVILAPLLRKIRAFPNILTVLMCCCGVSFDICVRCIKSATCRDFVIAVQHLVVDRRSKFLDADHGSSFSCHFR